MDHTLDIFNEVKAHMHSQGDNPSVKHIGKITYSFDISLLVAAVNQFTVVNQERVIIIFESENVFLICTENRGLLHGNPILVMKRNVSTKEYFDRQAH